MSKLNLHQQKLVPVVSPNRVLTLPQWAEVNSISLKTGKRLLAAGQGPRVTQLSERRIGIREIDNAEWQASRVRDV
jgi:predicted DNA-binding transcriptional regulator AlpA